MGHHPLCDALWMRTWLWLGILGSWAGLQGRSARVKTTPVLPRPSRSAPRSPHAVLDSCTNRSVTSVHMPLPAAHKHPVHRYLC
jgi:hypothetical protein